MYEQARRRGFHLVRTLLILILLGVAVYLSWMLSPVIRPKYQYETAVDYTMSDALELEGLVLFEETDVSGQGALGYLVENGERVSAGQQIAEIYSDPSLIGLRGQIQALDNRISLLHKSQNTSASQINTLLTQSSSALFDLLDRIDHTDLASIAESRDAFLLAQNRIRITTGEEQDFNARIARLEEERSLLAAELGSPEPLYAGVSGYFVSDERAARLSCTRQEALDLSPAALAVLLDAGVEIDGEPRAGKIVTNFRWYFCGVCPAEDAERFNGVKTVYLCFPGQADTELPATVVSVVADKESGLAKVTLSCEYIGAEILNLGQETGRIVFQHYEGLRISAAAVRMQKQENVVVIPASPAPSGAPADWDAEPTPTPEPETYIDENYVIGVYVRSGNVARFRRITVLYQNDDYVLIPLNGQVGTANEVRRYDEIILEGMDLYDGKIM